MNNDTRICAARSRALMEIVYRVIEWEQGLVEEHPLLPDAPLAMLLEDNAQGNVASW